MNIERMKDWACENWQVILVAFVISILGVSAYNYRHEKELKYKRCEEFELIDKFEENDVSWGYIIYYSDGRIEESRSLPACIKLNK
jgi:hypothetical protein